MLPPKTHLLMYQNGKSAAQCRSAQERQILSAFNGPISFLRFINCGLILQFSPLLHLLTSIISSFFHLHEPICFSNLVSERSAALWHPARLNVRRFFFVVVVAISAHISRRTCQSVSPREGQVFFSSTTNVNTVSPSQIKCSLRGYYHAEYQTEYSPLYLLWYLLVCLGADMLDRK